MKENMSTLTGKFNTYAIEMAQGRVLFIEKVGQLYRQDFVGPQERKRWLTFGKVI